VDDRLVVGQLDVGPDASREEALMSVDELGLYVHEVQPAGGKARPVLAPLVLLVERDCAEVDDFHRPVKLESCLDQLALVGPDNALGDGLFHLTKTALDFLSLGGGAELAE